MSRIKKCYTCQTVKSIEFFNKNKSKKDGLSSICKDCSRARSKRYYAENGAAHRIAVQKYKKENYARARAHSLGINQNEVEEVLRNNNGRCHCCDKKRKLVIDHDHTTLKVRGLLCISCNTGIGKLGDSITGVSLALDYLQNAGN